jgi:type III secretion protein L
MTQHDEIVDQARSAYEAERRRGYAEGTEAARLEQAGRMAETVGRTVSYFSEVEDTVVDLVLEAIERTVMACDARERIAAVVRNLLEAVRKQKHLSMRVNPANVAAVREQLAQLLAEFPAIESVEVIGDERQAADACTVESEIGTVEASTSGQLAALRETFEKVFGQAAPTDPAESDDAA